jgi:Domain of unknown function (DUF4145)
MKEGTNYDKIYCAGCMTSVQPVIISVHKKEMEEDVIDYEDIFDDGIIVDKQEKVIGIIRYEQCTELLECSNKKCAKTFMRKYTQGDIVREVEMIPMDKRWHRETREDLIRAIPHRKSVSLYREVIKAFNSMMNYSCGFLLGAVIESICFEEKIKQDIKDETGKTIISLGWQITKLINSGKLDVRFRQMIVDVKELRNDVAHEIIIPTSTELIKSIEVLEAVLEEMYLANYDLNIQKKKEENRLKIETEMSELTAKRRS